jgi:hypothetical protein
MSAQYDVPAYVAHPFACTPLPFPPHSHPIHPSPVLSSPSMLLTCLSPHPALVLPPRLLQRYQNVKSELEAQQNLERIRAEKMAQAGLLATASPAMLAGASGIAATGGKQVRRSRGWDRRARSGMQEVQSRGRRLALCGGRLSGSIEGCARPLQRPLRTPPMSASPHAVS